MSRQISLKRVLKETRAVVRERGEDWVYPEADGPSTGCHYRWDGEDVDNGFVTEDEAGQPACIVGAVLHRLGLLDAIPEEQNAEVGFAMLEVSDRFDPAARHFLEQAQEHQDDSSPWGEAVERAEASVKDLFGEEGPA